MTTDLPPRPGSQSGEPRPPRAPVDSNSEPDPKQPYHSKKVLAGPEGSGPPLEWHYGDRTFQISLSAGVFGISIILLFFKSGTDWLDEWIVWATILAFTALAWILPKGHKISAGSDWLNTRGETVKLYNLTAIKIKGTAGGYNIHLHDADGHEADTGLDLIHSNRELWDLVYNGIRHSLANGAELNPLAREKLQLGREHRGQDSSP